VQGRTCSGSPLRRLLRLAVASPTPTDPHPACDKHLLRAAQCRVPATPPLRFHCRNAGSRMRVKEVCTPEVTRRLPPPPYSLLAINAIKLHSIASINPSLSQAITACAPRPPPAPPSSRLLVPNEQYLILVNDTQKHVENSTENFVFPSLLWRQ
jgi:hypothetical protein